MNTTNPSAEGQVVKYYKYFNTPLHPGKFEILSTKYETNTYNQNSNLQNPHTTPSGRVNNPPQQCENPRHEYLNTKQYQILDSRLEPVPYFDTRSEMTFSYSV